MFLTIIMWLYYFMFFSKIETTFNNILSFFKRARMVNVKLGFMDWSFYNLVILIKWYKIPYKNLEKLRRKLWRVPTTAGFHNFCWNFVHFSYLSMSTKCCSGFYFFCLILRYLPKSRKTWFLHTNRNQVYQ